MLQADSLHRSIADTSAGLTGHILPDYGAAVFILIVIFLGLLFTLARPKGSDPTPLSQILQRATQDGVPGVLALVLTGTIIALAVTQVPIPEVLLQAFLIIIGYYFGQQTKSPATPAANPPSQASGDAATNLPP